MNRSWLVSALACAIVSTGLVLGGTPAQAQQRDSREQSTGEATWTRDSFDVGEGGTYLVNGTVSGPGKRHVEIQVETDHGWAPLQVGRSVDHEWIFTGPLDWYGNHKVRVVASGTSKYTPLVIDEHRVKVGMDYEPRGSARDYTLLRFEGRRIRMNPCEPIRWRLAASAPGWQVKPIVTEALRRVSLASGVEFMYAGRSHRIPLDSRGIESDTNLLIGWATQRQRPMLVGKAAVSQTIRKYPSRDADGPIWNVTQTGITFNTDLTVGRGSRLDPGLDSKRRTTLGMIVMHEVAHALGVGHAPAGARDELLYFSTAMKQWPDGMFRARYGRGDLAALAQVGLGGGCVR